MQVTETQSEGLKREFKIVVPAADIQSEVDARIDELSRTIEFKGFRKGKVPVTLIRNKYAPSVLGEVLEKAVDKSSRQAIVDKGVRPALQPKIEITNFAEGTDLEYTMALEILPDVDPGDLNRLTLTRLAVDVDDTEVTKALDRLAEQDKQFAAVKTDRAAETGNQVVIDFVGQVDGETIKDGTAEGFELELGTDMLIPGFEDQLVGAKAGDHVTVTADFPADYPAEELAGKTATFAVDVKELREREAVTVDEAFAERRGLESLDKLKDIVRNQLDQEYVSIARGRLKRELFDKLAEGHDFALPDGMKEQEFETVWKQLTDEMERSKTSFEDLEKSEDESRAEYYALTERRLRLGLLLAEIGQSAKIEVNKNELIQAAVRRTTTQFPGQEQQVLEFYEKNPDALEEFHGAIFEEKVVDHIVDMATVTDKKVTIEELLAPPEEPVEGAKTEDSASDKKATKAAKTAKTKAPRKSAKTKPKPKPKSASDSTGD